MCIQAELGLISVFLLTPTHLYFPFRGVVVRCDREQDGGLLQHPGSVPHSHSG